MVLCVRDRLQSEHANELDWQIIACGLWFIDSAEICCSAHCDLVHWKNVHSVSSEDKLWFCLWVILLVWSGHWERLSRIEAFEIFAASLMTHVNEKSFVEIQSLSAPFSFPPYPSHSIPIQKLVWKFAANLLTSDLRSHQRQPFGAENYPINSSEPWIYPFQLIPSWITRIHIHMKHCLKNPYSCFSFEAFNKPNAFHIWFQTIPKRRQQNFAPTILTFQAALFYSSNCAEIFMWGEAPPPHFHNSSNKGKRITYYNVLSWQESNVGKGISSGVASAHSMDRDCMYERAERTTERINHIKFMRAKDSLSTVEGKHIHIS